MALPEDTDSDFDGLSDSEEERLLRQYRPYWYFDGQEFIFPISITDWANLGRWVEDGGEKLFYTNIVEMKNAVQILPNGKLAPHAHMIGGWRENAPVYVDALLMPPAFSDAGRDSLVWLQYWLLFGDDRKYDSFNIWHRGDWEHICVLVERNRTSIKTTPVKIHWHHHGGADISSSAYAYHSDTYGTRHPRVYIEAGAHGMFRDPGDGLYGPHDDNGGSADNPLDNQMIFMVPHWSNRSSRYEQDILAIFNGLWGNAWEWPTGPPKGPLEFNDSCDHDYRSFPTSGSFKIGSSDCGVISQSVEDYLPW